MQKSWSKSIFFWVPLICFGLASPFLTDISKFERPVGVFAHGFWDFKTQVDNYKDFFPCQLISFSFPDARNNKISLRQANLAQKKDINTLYQACQTMVALCDEIFLVGLSRGAATIATLLGTRDLPQVKAAILESPFDCMDSVVNCLIKKRLHLGWFPGLTKFAKHALPWVFRKYKRDGVRPIDVVQNFPKDLPVLIVCSKEDKLVPAQGTIRLYKKLRKTGHNHAHLLVLNEGEHSKLVFGPEASKYKEVLHAFNKKYGLPHDSDCADRGEAEFSLCQPDVESLASFFP